MKVLIASATNRIFALKEFAEEISKYDITVKAVDYNEVFSHSFGFTLFYQILKYTKFNEVTHDFKPDLILLDGPSLLGTLASRKKIPVVILLRGNYWLEMKWDMERPSLKYKIWVWALTRNANISFQKSSAILPICEHLSTEVKKRLPRKTVRVLYNGIDPSKWFIEGGMQLKHPCVGILQNAIIIGKVREFLEFKKVMQALPEITFYWAGGGRYKDLVLRELDCDNFVWLGELSYPDSVRKYLSAIDIFAHPSGIDMSPGALLEAQIMQKAVLSTNVGGIPENMINGTTGYLIEKGDTSAWVNKIRTLIENPKLAENMGRAGKEFVVHNFNWKRIAKNFIMILNDLGLRKDSKILR